MIALATRENTGAATCPPRVKSPDGSSIFTRIEISGASYGKKPANDAIVVSKSYPSLVETIVVPVFPATA